MKYFLVMTALHNIFDLIMILINHREQENFYRYLTFRIVTLLIITILIIVNLMKRKIIYILASILTVILYTLILMDISNEYSFYQSGI